MGNLSNIIRERIITLYFRDLDEQKCAVFAERLSKFIQEGFEGFSFSEERLNIPKIRRPKMTKGLVDPDWHEMRAMVTRSYRHIDRAHKFVVQICPAFFTVNAISANLDKAGALPLEDLRKFYRRFMPFLSEHFGRKNTIKSLELEDVCRLDKEHLRPFLLSRESEDDYLDIQALMYNPSIDPKLPGMQLWPPLRQSSVYAFEKDPLKRQMRMLIEIPVPKNNAWNVSLELEATSSAIPCHENDWGENSDLEGLNELIATGLRNLFSPKAVKYLGIGE